MFPITFNDSVTYPCVIFCVTEEEALEQGVEIDDELDEEEE
jgi:hypothetical protein